MKAENPERALASRHDHQPGVWEHQRLRGQCTARSAHLSQSLPGGGLRPSATAP